MALNCKVGTVTISTGAVGTTFDVTGLTGFDTSTKKAVILWWSGRGTTGFGEDDLRAGQGFFVGTASRRSYTTWSDHGAADTLTAAVRHDDCCISTIATTGTLDGKADIDSIIANGFRLIVDDQFTNAVVVGYLAIWGSDLQEAGIVDFDSPGATGDQDLNFGFALDTGKNDKGVIIISNRAGTFGTIAAIGSAGMGVVAGDTISQAAMGMRLNSGVATTLTNTASISGQCINGISSADTLTHRANATTWLSTGLRINWAETVAGWNSSALALKGGQYLVGSILSQTGTSDTDETVGITPKAILAFSGNGAETASDSVVAHGQMSVGAASGAAERAVAFVGDQDNIADSDIGVGFRDDAFYARIDITNAVKAEIGRADLVDFVIPTSGGFTFVMDDADPDQAFIPYLAMGAAPDATPAGIARVPSSPMRW